ncbi:DUF5058 family protein [Bariatricus massiliensis]|uniref:DUF5058 family protein n=1 Tax=Bariatricus massiliensis TaxID=1745713 RepID=A0ABS8DJ05_9FIRM|nr:DUF5058 family protein [Bariatricus massiliensis]MCB7305104.1 DUF5058 family protein [Bariatricus massiliensis]MCB7375555.1 DUF5058 family protein [Bariatricus massiliensis]MCB7388144.1 DUF5058 family protein [Bariatricus massiliensis]MCB7412420.1 DUF5058 family protein [Bariatricus massiliensis]MCQ5254596.1 DUF5058 family protein [Bariatricus massiliensis]
MGKYLQLANSWPVFLFCLVPIIAVILQSLKFISIARKEAKSLGMEDEKIKKVMTNSAVFSILPSLPIIITMAALMPVLGKFIPWLRLSVIGSAMYESMCADLTITSFGFSGLGSTDITIEAWVGVVWVMCIVALVWPLCNVIGLRGYDKGMKKISGPFMGVLAASLFMGMMGIMGIPKFLNFADPVSILVAVVSGISVLILELIAKKTGVKVLSEFSFPLAMILGMASAMIAS